MTVHELDETDLCILRSLQENSRLTTKELALKIHLSTTPTFERQRRLERLGYIKKYVAVLDGDLLEKGFVVFCSVSMKQINHEVAAMFSGLLETWDEVTECYNTSGDGDYLMKVCVSSMRQYQQFILDKVGQFEYVSHVRSVFVMDTLKLNYGVPI